MRRVLPSSPVAVAVVFVVVALLLLAGCGPTYRNCAEARDAGVAPLHAGDPGYSRELDRDGDGTACENPG